MAHELAQVAQRGFQEKMEVVGHEDVARKLDGVNMEGLAQDLKEALAVGVVLVDLFLFIAPAADVVDGTGILDAQRSSHVGLYHEQENVSTIEI
jgi:hypothetical protein